MSHGSETAFDPSGLLVPVRSVAELNELEIQAIGVAAASTSPPSKPPTGATSPRSARSIRGTLSNFNAALFHRGGAVTSGS